MNKEFKLFEGQVFHKRYINYNHSFKNKSLFLLINLNKLSDLISKNQLTLPLFFSINKFNFLSWNCFDHAERKNNSKPNDILNFVNRLNKGKEFDEVYLFCFPRSLGFGFNPLSIYFCYKNKLLSEIIFEVKNTFGDIHHYILTNVKRNGLKQKVNKKLFVSPFFDNKGYYELTSNYKKNKIIVEIKYYKNKKIQLYANLNAKETGFSNFEIIKNLLKFVIFPGKNWINIHLEALKLWTKKIKIYKTPKEKSLKFSKALKIK